MHWLKYVKTLSLYRQVICSLFILPIYTTGYSQESSVLSTGLWYKLAVTQTGVYQINYDMLRKMGVDVATISPDRIQIYDNGGRMLPQANHLPRPVDLVQNAIAVKGQEDGKFDPGDLIYFYAEGPHVIQYDSINSNLFHQVNIYSDTTYYFLTFGESQGLRIKTQASLGVAPTTPVSQFDDYWFHEQEITNLLRSGRDWWGEYLGTASGVTVQAPLPGIVPGTDLLFSASAIAAAQTPTRFIWQVNGQEVGRTSMDVVSPGLYDLKGLRADRRFRVNSGDKPAASVSLTASFDRNGQSSAQAYLNYLSLQVKRELSAYEGQQIYHFTPGRQDTITYQFKSIPADWQWWDVSDAQRPSVAALNASRSFAAKGGKQYRRFVGFSPALTYEPVGWRRVGNQNIRKHSTPELLIVTAGMWRSEAERLAVYRREQTGLEALVVAVDEVYNEFSSGKTDVTALRDYIRHLYQKNPDRLKYVLLFGDATYDYRNKLENQSERQRDGWIPVYESRESLNPVATYSSDDYFGFMDVADGEWLESGSGDHVMQVGVGRLPVKSLAEARVVVDKIMHYERSATTLGPWRNKVSFVADDGDYGIHQQHADELARLVSPSLLSKRIFLDRYPQQTTELGQKVPGVNKAILDGINDGTLILNYTGHGGTSGWAEEQVLTLSDIQAARGYNNLPLLITATCDFSRYDDPSVVSGGELMVLSPRGAAIAAVSTTRPVYSSTNFLINKAFYEAINALGPSARLGDIVRLTKNRSQVGNYNRNFTLLGDPSMRLSGPRAQVRWVEQPDTLRALQSVSLKGGVYLPGASQPDATFNGTVRVVIYDKEVSFRTLGNESEVSTYNEFSSKLFDGIVSVEQGLFTCRFVMPKDIDYRIGLGKASLYAVRSDSLLDASGQLDIWVGGSVNPTVDRQPPQITAYIDHPSFKDGDIVSENAVLFLNLSDENGINVSKSGIGHDLIAVLNDTLSIVLTDYYVADKDQYRNGTVKYPFKNLPSGNYTVRIKVWDTYNNSSEITFGFQVGPASGIQLNAMKVYPNPFDQEFSFELNHNRADDDLEVVLRMYHSSGQHFLTLRWQYYNSKPIIKETIPSLHLKTLNAPGREYIYSFQIRSMKDNSIASQSGKLLRLP
jgi:hypothetical protein